jgi:hypothetical protein
LKDKYLSAVSLRVSAQISATIRTKLGGPDPENARAEWAQAFEKAVL